MQPGTLVQRSVRLSPLEATCVTYSKVNRCSADYGSIGQPVDMQVVNQFIPATMAVHTVSCRSLAPDVANMPIVQHACLLHACEEDRV